MPGDGGDVWTGEENKQYCTVTNEGRKFPQPPCMAAVETFAPLIYCAILFILVSVEDLRDRRALVEDQGVVSVL